MRNLIRTLTYCCLRICSSPCLLQSVEMTSRGICHVMGTPVLLLGLSKENSRVEVSAFFRSATCTVCKSLTRMRDDLTLMHSRPQRPRSFWSAPRIATSGQVQQRKSAIHGLPVTLRMLRVKSDKSDWFWSQSIVFTRPEVAILGADQKERGLWGREWL